MSIQQLTLPDGSNQQIEVQEGPIFRPDSAIRPARLAYAAGHLVTKIDRNALAPIQDQIDWERSLAFRHHLWKLGLGVAEAMDTAQRDVLGWGAAAELIDRTLAEGRERKSKGLWAETVCGADTGDLSGEVSFSQIVDEYVRQGRFIQERGGAVILMATPLMPKLFPKPDQYVDLYKEVANQLESPILLHWLGEMFAPALAGYFPENSFYEIMDNNADKILGVKISLLDEAFELSVRERIAKNNQVVFTGDDFNYSNLILGDGTGQLKADSDPSSDGANAFEGATGTFEINGHTYPVGNFSHALLGIFDAIAPVAAHALERLSAGDVEGYKALMEPTVPLGRHLFCAPTSAYKAGVIYLAHLNGHQDHFDALVDLHKKRSTEHYAEIIKLANDCGALQPGAYGSN